MQALLFVSLLSASALCAQSVINLKVVSSTPAPNNLIQLTLEADLVNGQAPISSASATAASLNPFALG